MKSKQIFWILAAFLIAAPFVNAVTDFTTNITDYWTFDNTTTSYKGINCSLAGTTPTLKQTPIGYAYSFDGSSGRIMCENNASKYNLTGDYTFTFATNQTSASTPGTVNRVLGIGKATPDKSIRFSVAGTTWGGGVKSGIYHGGNDIITTAISDPSGQWTYWTITRRSNNLTFYRNNVSYYSTINNSIREPDSNLSIGCSEATAGTWNECFVGVIDELGIYMKRGFTQSEVSDAYACFLQNKSLIQCSITSNQAFAFNGSSIPANNSQFLQNYINISQNATLTNNTMNCSLILDGVNNETKQYSNLTNQSYFFSITYDKVLSFASHNYSISCKSLITNETTNTTTSRFILVDNQYTITNNNITYEKNNEAFLFHILALSNINHSEAYLHYNGTRYTPSEDFHTHGGEFSYHFNYTKEIPFVPLNQTNITFFWNYTLFYTNGSNFTNVTANQIQTILWNTTYNRLNFSAYDRNNTKLNNFSITIEGETKNTTTGSVLFTLLNGTYNASIDAPGYAITASFFNATQTISNVNFSLYTTNSINFTFKNDVTKAIINNVTFELISSVYSNNYSTTTGSLYLDLLSPELYTIRYTSPGYSSRFYVFELLNRTTNALTLYLSQNTSAQACTATIVNEVNRPIEGAYLKTYKYDLTTNSYLLQEIAASNFEGKSIVNLLLNTEYYKFVVEYPFGTIVLETSPTYVYSTSLRFQVITTQKTAENYFNLLDVNNYLTFNNDTNNFRFFYSYGGTDLSQACLRVYKVESTSSDTLINTSCATSASATLLIGVANESGTTYIGKGYVTLSGQEYFLNSYIQSFPEEAGGGGNYGWWILFVITAALMTLYLWDKSVGLVVMPLPTLIFSYMNFVDLPFWIALSMEIVFIILAYWVSKK